MKWLLLGVLVSCTGNRVPKVDASARRGDGDGGDCYMRCAVACGPEQARICQDGCDANGEPRLDTPGCR